MASMDVFADAVQASQVFHEKGVESDPRPYAALTIRVTNPRGGEDVLTLFLSSAQGLIGLADAIDEIRSEFKNVATRKAVARG